MGERGSVDWSRTGPRGNMGPAQPFRTTDDMESGWPGAGPEMADGPFIASRPQGIQHGAYVLGQDTGATSDQPQRRLAYYPRLPAQNSAEALIHPRTTDFGPGVEIGQGPTDQMLALMNDHNAAHTYDMSPNELLALQQRGEAPGLYAGQDPQRVAMDLERKVQQSMANGDIPRDRPIPDDEGGPIAMSTPEPGDFRKPAKPTTGAAVDVNPSSIPEKGTTIQPPPWYEEFGLTKKDMEGREEPVVQGKAIEPGTPESPFGEAGSVQGEAPAGWFDTGARQQAPPPTEPPSEEPVAGQPWSDIEGNQGFAIGGSHPPQPRPLVRGGSAINPGLDPSIQPEQLQPPPAAPVEQPETAMPSRNKLLGSWANREPQDVQRSNAAIRQAAHTGQPLVPEYSETDEADEPAPEIEDPDAAPQLDPKMLKK